jgi:hypothetical protein
MNPKTYKIMKKTLLSLLLMLLPVVASADAVEIGGIYYNLNSADKTAEVTSNPDNYTGDVEIPASVFYESDGETYAVTSIGEKAFYRCRALMSINIPNSVTSIGKLAFWGCEGLTSLDIPNSVTFIGDCAFQECEYLTSVTIPNSITTISKDMFSNCFSLTSVTIPNSVTIIGTTAFNGCKALTSVTIPNSVTSIGDYAFINCKALRSMAIGKSVTSIGMGPFESCPELTDVYCFCETVPSTDSNAFDSSNPENITLHVPAVSADLYKAAEPWSKFKEVVGIEQCAKPTITLADGKLTFSSETEGATFVYQLSSNGEGQTVTSPTTYTVSVYAKKEGLMDSKTVTMTTPLTFEAGGLKGDVDGDGEVNAVDLTKLIEILLQ